jgi:hypothetical protein
MMHRYRGRAIQIVFGDPLPEKHQPAKPLYKNIIAQAVRIRHFLTEDAQRSYLHASQEFRITRARVSQLMKIVDNLPSDFIAQMAECQDQRLIGRFSGKTLHRITSMNNPNDRKAHIQYLLEPADSI